MQRILVIEDEDEIKDSIIDILKSKGFMTAGASNGRIGLQVAKKFRPDLILCDVDMPELSGYDFLKELRQFPDLGNIPFIFLTALSSAKDFRKGMNLGADDYLTKPFQVDELLAAIAARLRKQANLKVEIIYPTISKNQISQRQSSEKLRLTKRQHTILQLVTQNKPITELANELDVSVDAAELLEDIAIRLNHRLNLNPQLDQTVPNQQDRQLQTTETDSAISIHEERLTPRQREILRLVANGMTTKEIAESLFISVKTVETHRGQLMDRLNIHDLAGLIRYAIRVGLISLDE